MRIDWRDEMKENGIKDYFQSQDIVPPVFPERMFSVERCEGNTSIITQAINRCAELGGGTIRIPSGLWISGPIHFKSNVRLHLEEGAVISFITSYESYLPVVFTRWEGMECYNYTPLIYAKDCENIAITGSGKLLGNGEAWWGWKKKQQEAATDLCYAQCNGVEVEKRIYGTEKSALRPSFLQPINCKKVLIEGITIENGPQWTIHPVYCEDVIVRGVKIKTEGPNTDGLNPDSCNNVLIEDCEFNTGDDCIAINSGMNEDGWRVNKPCRNIIIRRCKMMGGYGGIVIGSGMSGGVENVYVNECQISGTMQGIRMKSMRGRGGYVKNITIEDVSINNVSREAVQINMFYEYSTVMPQRDTPPDFHNITIKNIDGKGAKTAVEMKGLPERKLKQIKLNHIHLEACEAFVCSDVEDLDMHQIQIRKTK